MRWLIVGLCCLCGCTHIGLQHRAINQGSTLSAIQYQQVLNNLAMFTCDPDALAWHVKITGGVVQLSDQGNAAVVPAAVGNGLLAPNIGASRNVLEQWNMDSVIESDDLTLLQIAYQKAIHPDDPDRSLKKQAFENICELSTTHHIILSPEVLAELIETMMINASPEKAEKLRQTGVRLRELYKRWDELGDKVDLEPHSEQAAGPLHTELVAVKREILKLTCNICDQPFSADYVLERTHGTPAIEQAEGKIRALHDLVTDRGDEANPFAVPWLCHGCKRDLPPCVCHVGKYHGCQGDCYVWVLPEHTKTLRDFTLLILSLVPPDCEEFSAPRLGVGAAFSPGI